MGFIKIALIALRRDEKNKSKEKAFFNGADLI